MTRLLNEAIKKLRSPREDEQDRYGDFLLREIEQDRKGEATRVRHAGNLRKLADRAVADDDAGLADPLHPDEL